MVHGSHFVCHFAWSWCFFYALLTLMSFECAANVCVVIASLAIHCAKLPKTANLQTFPKTANLQTSTKRLWITVRFTMDQHILIGHAFCLSSLTHYSSVSQPFTSPSFFQFPPLRPSAKDATPNAKDLFISSVVQWNARPKGDDHQTNEEMLSASSWDGSTGSNWVISEIYPAW